MVSDRKQFTFSDLRVRYGTGRCYTISGSGRDRVTGYRVGMMCAAGDIEESEWCKLMKDLIFRSGEQEIYKHLLTFVKENYHHLKTKSEVEKEALKLHASRIFDDEAWVLFVKFNQQYRPEVLDPRRLRYVRTDCCHMAGLTTQTIIDKYKGTERGIPCPVCGRWSSYVFVDEENKEEKESAT